MAPFEIFGLCLARALALLAPALREHEHEQDKEKEAADFQLSYGPFFCLFPA
ncbi:MAG: hypothetical protein ABI318_09580 [Chthoniobacteraceae bacterium]